MPPVTRPAKFRIVRTAGAGERARTVHYRSPETRDAGARRFAALDGHPVVAQFLCDGAWTNVAVIRPGEREGQDMFAKTLMLSTAHLPEHLGADGLDQVGEVGADSIEGGWFIYVPEDPDRPFDVPDEIRALQHYAKKHGCRFIHLHCDNDTTDDLPTWDW